MGPSLGLLFMLCFGVFFYKAAELENRDRPLLWGGASILVSLLAVYWLRWGWCVGLLLQVALFLTLAVVLQLEKRRRDQSMPSFGRQEQCFTPANKNPPPRRRGRGDGTDTN